MASFTADQIKITGKPKSVSDHRPAAPEDRADLGSGERADAAVAPGLLSDEHESGALAWRKRVQEFRRDG